MPQFQIYQRKFGSHTWERRKDSEQRPKEDVWKEIQVSDMGRVKLEKHRVTYGVKMNGGYLCVMVGGMNFQVHVLIALAFKLEQIKDGYHIDHIDHDKHNNKSSNLNPCDRKKHVQKTLADNPNMKVKCGIALSHMLELIESPDKSQIGLIKTTTEWAKELNLTPGVINSALARKGLANKKYKFKKIASQLLKGERAISHIIYVEGNPCSYNVTTFGRIWSAKRWQKKNNCGFAGKIFQVHQLVLLAKTRYSQVPIHNGKLMSVDHIHGREHEWPHRMSNLRWADPTTQVFNRAPKN
jgi:hypothetical protein